MRLFFLALLLLALVACAPTKAPPPVAFEIAWSVIPATTPPVSSNSVPMKVWIAVPVRRKYIMPPA